MPIKIPQSLAAELVKKKLLSPENAEAFAQQAKEQNKDFGRVLVEKKVIREEDLLNIKADV